MTFASLHAYNQAYNKALYSTVTREDPNTSNKLSKELGTRTCCSTVMTTMHEDHELVP